MKEEIHLSGYPNLTNAIIVSIKVLNLVKLNKNWYIKVQNHCHEQGYGMTFNFIRICICVCICRVVSYVLGEGIVMTQRCLGVGLALYRLC